MIPLSVFVVHPDAAVASRIARAVAAAGHAPVLLADGERAIDRFVLEPADVLVLDYFLPGRDGVATIESIRWAPGGRDAHVVLLADREPEDGPLAELGKRVRAVATFVAPGDRLEDAIAGVLASLGRGPVAGESTRVATVDELSGALERVGLPTGALDHREADREAARRGRSRDDVTTTPGEDVQDAWPAIETVMLHAGRGAPQRGQEGGSGVQRRPTADDDDATARPQGERRLTTPPPAMPARETTRELELARSRIGPKAEPDLSAEQEGRDVREGARAAAEGSQRIMGRFEDTAFAALLRRLADGRVTGALVCIADGLARETTTGDPPTKIVYFRSGVPVHVRSNLVDECLGQILLRRRRIGAATLEESIRRMRLGHGLQGEILIDMGALAPIELSEALADQSRDKLFDVFAWQRGTYRLSTKLEIPQGAVGIELALAEIVYEGVCAAMSPQRLLALLSPSLDRFVVPDPVQLARFVRVRLVPEVRHVLAKIDGSLRLREVLSMGSRPGAVAQLVYSMECLGAVRFSESPRTSSAGRDPAPHFPEQLAIMPRSAVPPSTMPLSTMPLSTVPPSTVPPAPGEGPPDVEPVPGPDDDEAAEAAAQAEAEGEGRTPHEVASVPPTGEAWDDSTAPHRERVAPPPRVTIVDGAADGSGLHATPEREEHGASVSSEEAIPAGGLDARVDRLFEAERHFRRGNRALDRGRLGEALAAFARAFELCPDQGEFLAYVGWARHCLAPDDPGATEAALAELAQSRELAPEIHVTHLLHARVLASAGRVEEAQGAYLRVLDLDPACAEARDALR